MGFYVPTNRDVKFPEACEQCHFYDGLLCCVMDTYVHDPENKHEECPLIEIPDNHGRLGDLDELYASLKKWLIQNRHSMTEATRVWIRGVLEGIAAAPTIISEDEMV